MSPAARPRAARPAPARFYRAEAYRIEESLGYLMRRTMACLSHALDRRLAAHDLTDAQWKPLFLLHHRPGSTVAELAREGMCDAGATTRMLDRLEAKGLIARTRSSSDRRVVHVELTAEGERLAERIPHVLADTLNEHLAGFTRDEWQALKGYLRRIVANSENAAQGGAPGADA